MRHGVITQIMALLICLMIGSYQVSALLFVDSNQTAPISVQNHKSSPCEQQNRGVNQCTSNLQYSAADLFELPTLAKPLLNVMLLLFSYCFIIKVTTSSPLKRPPKPLMLSIT